MTDDHSVLIRRQSSGPWSTPEVRAYTDEAHLQEILVADPARVPGVAEGARAVDELVTSAGPIDVCIVEPDGRLTVVECKLASNSERRRMVIGQVIDYAAAIWQDGDRRFSAAWCARGGPDLSEVLSSTAMERLSADIGDGRINLCLAVDHIDADLRRLVEYLNLITADRVAVTALQLAYARDGDVEILIPSTFGGELAATKDRAAGRQRTPWTRPSFLQALDEAVERPLAEEIFGRLEGLERRGRREPIWYGAEPGGSLYLHPFGLERGPVHLWPNAAGRLLVYGTWNTWTDTAGHDGFERLARLLGQDHRTSSSRGVQVASLDIDELWATAVECTLAINGASVEQS